MKPKYVVNGYYAHLWFTSDDFLKNFRWPDENFLKFHEIFIRPSELSQKVIRSEPGTLEYVIKNIFRFDNILISIYDFKFIFVIFEETNSFFLFLFLKKKHQKSRKLA